MAAHLGHRRRSGIEIGADEVAPLLGVEPRGNPGRTHQVAEHHREIAALGGFRPAMRGGGGRRIGARRPNGVAAGTGQVGATGSLPNSAIAASIFRR